MGFFSKDVYGSASLAEALKGVDFPATTHQLIEQVGDEDVQWFKDAEPLKAREILEKLDYATFDTPNDVIEAVSRDVTIV